MIFDEAMQCSRGSISAPPCLAAKADQSSGTCDLNDPAFWANHDKLKEELQRNLAFAEHYWGVKPDDGKSSQPTLTIIDGGKNKKDAPPDG